MIRMARRKRIGGYKRSGLKGFRQSFERFAPRRTEERRLIKVLIMDQLGTSERNFYQILNGERSMSLQEWSTIKRVFAEFGYTAEIDKACNEKITDGVVKIEDTSFYEILEDSIMEAALSCELDTKEYIEVDYSARGYYFNVDFLVSEDRYSTRFFEQLNISGGFTENEIQWDYSYLIKYLMRKKF